MCMDSKEYKNLTSLWSVKRRNIIEDSIALIGNTHSFLAKKLRETLECESIEKPVEHTGGSESDYFAVLLSEKETQELIDVLFDLEAAAVPQGDGVGFEKEALQAREACRIASLVDEWNQINAD